MFWTEDGRLVETRAEAATIYLAGYDGEWCGPFTPQEVNHMASWGGEY